MFLYVKPIIFDILHECTIILFWPIIFDFFINGAFYPRNRSTK
jgi:hypothetical protein